MEPMATRLTARRACAAWAIRVTDWLPNADQYVQAIAALPSVERDQVSRYVFQRDERASLVGRLAARALCAQLLSVPPSALEIGRTEKGKPVLRSCRDEELHFNVSHDGDYVVAAVSARCRIGVDVMRIGRPIREHTSDDYFRVFRKQFDDEEWSLITGQHDEHSRLLHFYRHWCLKEAYVKAIGYGIGFGVQRIHVRIQSDLTAAKYLHDATIRIDDTPLNDWLIYEYLLDSDHCVAVAIESGRADAALSSSWNHQCRNMEKLSVDDIVAMLEPLESDPHNLLPYYQRFSEKERQPKFSKIDKLCSK